MKPHLIVSSFLVLTFAHGLALRADSTRPKTPTEITAAAPAPDHVILAEPPDLFVPTWDDIED